MEHNLKVRLEHADGERTVSFSSSAVLAHHYGSQSPTWDSLSADEQRQFAENYALWNWVHRFGDEREYRVDLLSSTPLPC